jgi:competence protein ComEA
MRLRRLELVVIGVTLAFACFMGGFFTGRSWSVVDITAVATQNGEAQGVGISITTTGGAAQDGTMPADNSHNDATSREQPQNDTGGNSQTESAGAPRGGDGKININLATQSELMDLPGIGSVLASRIVDYRRQHGDFSRIEDLRSVSGIGEKRYEAIQDKITVG